MLIVPLLQYIVTTYQLVLFSFHDSSQGKECITHSELPPAKMWGRSASPILEKNNLLGHKRRSKLLHLPSYLIEGPILSFLASLSFIDSILNPKCEGEHWRVCFSSVGGQLLESSTTSSATCMDCMPHISRRTIKIIIIGMCTFSHWQSSSYLFSKTTIL